MIAIQRRAERRQQTGRLLEILDADRQPVQRAEAFAPQNRALRLPRFDARPVIAGRGDRIHGGIDRLDPRDAGI